MSLFDYINRYVAIDREEYELFCSHLRLRSYLPKERLLDLGKICISRFFITKGCVRLYNYTEEGKEQIYHFAIENWWISDYASLTGRSPSKQIIEAIEPTEVLELTNADFESLCRELPKVERLFRIIMEKTYIALQNRLEFLFNLTSEKQYLNFIKRNSSFVQRVPQYMIASYLGVTPEFISKIKSKNQ